MRRDAMIKTTAPLVLLLLSLTIASCRQADSDGADPAPVAVGEWQVLFDGTDTQHWRGYRKEGMPATWSITEAGALYTTGGEDGGDIVTKEQYGNFELELEWKVAEESNSGIMFRVTEDHDVPYRTGPEFQILDDSAYADQGLRPETSTGANYDMHAPSANVARPTGEWNHTRLIANGPHVEHWLNGEKIVEYELWSDDWKQRVAGSKWVEMPNYGMHPVGHICLQDHGNEIWFRNIRIRRLPDTSDTTN